MMENMNMNSSGDQPDGGVAGLPRDQLPAPADPPAAGECAAQGMGPFDYKCSFNKRDNNENREKRLKM